ncbi:MULTISPECIES: hypothetical protein [Corynebacterium]|uniref:hypothetical protein n=1 Tax=Corynebacterium TaxID=1716 RepID=UPI0008A4B7C9|nr:MULTISPECIES: hypothetical protein [Corynebacterium]OFT91813.1 hypothetical protein HMPREF3098_00075 [Corynebacterium sp. HMSC28B08]
MNWDLIWVPLGGVIVGILGFLDQWVAKRSDEKVKAIEYHGPEWQVMVKEVKDWANDRLAERDARINGFEGEMEKLADELEKLKGKYWKAINHIRELRSVAMEPVPALPIAIQRDV